MSIPDPVRTYDGKVVRVIDGDTIRVAFEFEANVRIRDLWCAETREQRDHPSEKQIGLRAKEWLTQLLVPGSAVRCVVRPKSGDPMESVTFGRLVADVFELNGIGDVALRMIQQNQGFRTKAELESFLTKQDGANHDEI